LAETTEGTTVNNQNTHEVQVKYPDIHGYRVVDSTLTRESAERLAREFAASTGYPVRVNSPIG
jgi:hypothetical protein